MESKVARDSRSALIAAIRQLTAEERLQAFLRHCRLMMALHRAEHGLRRSAACASARGPHSPPPEK